MYFSFVSICKYLLTAGLREQNINVTQLWPGILKFSQRYLLQTNLLNCGEPESGFRRQGNTKKHKNLLETFENNSTNKAFANLVTKLRNRWRTGH